MTKAEVPESTVDEQSAPLVLVFSTDAEKVNTRAFTKDTLRDALTDSLIFKVAVGSSAPTLNASFVSGQTPTLGHAQTWVFNYENVQKPQGPSDLNTMFLNANGSQPNLGMSNGYPQKTGDTNNCYTLQTNNDPHVQTLTVVGQASDVCPDNATIQVMTNNGKINSPIQTINITTTPPISPQVSGGTITNLVTNNTYSYAFSNAEISPGANAQFDTSSGNTYVKVFNNTNDVCEDVTSNFGLNVSGSAITLTSASIPKSLINDNLLVYFHLTNTAGGVYDSGTTSHCGQTQDASYAPFTASVKGAPVIPANIELGNMTVENSYSYDFMTQGSVTTGSSVLNTSVSSATILVKDNTGATVDANNLGLATQITADDVKLTGIPNPGYAGDTVYVTLNLVNDDGYLADNAQAPAYSLPIESNAVYAPSVAGGQTLTSGTQYSTYSYTFPNTGSKAVTAGTNETFDTAINKTYATVIDSVTQEDLSSQFALAFNADKTQVTLTSGTNTLKTQDSFNVVLHVANVDGQTADNVSDPDRFLVIAPSVTGYLTCPLPGDVSSTPSPYYRSPISYANLMSASTNGSILSTIGFDGEKEASTSSGSVKLYEATLSGKILTCKYISTDEPFLGLFDYIATTTIDTTGKIQGVSGTGWNNNNAPTSCFLGTQGESTPTSCQISYVYSD